MNEEDIVTVKQLEEFMEAEAALWSRHDSEQVSVNGAGIRSQWHERIHFPYCIMYMVGTKTDGYHQDGSMHIEHTMKTMWFDIDGNKTERPLRNTDTLYHNDG